MSIPRFDSWIEPTLRHLALHADGARRSELYDPVADAMGTTPEDRQQLLPSGRILVYRSRIGWALDYLKRAGLASRVARGVWKLTEKGAVLVSRRERLTGKEIERIAQADRDGEFDLDHEDSEEDRAIERFSAPRMLFDDGHYTVAQLLTFIELGDLALPEIQRPFVWKTSKVRDLLDSMYRGFPVGYLLLWGTSHAPGAEGQRSIGTDPKQHRTPAFLIIDGQQRLTSLYAGLKGRPILDNEFRERKLEIAFRPRDGVFEVTDAAIRKDYEFIPNISELWASKKGTLRIVTDFLTALKDRREVSGDEQDAIAENLDRLIALQEYRFMALRIGADVTDEEEVANIFVRINSEGVSLKQSDFILTLLSVFWDEGRNALEEFSRAAKVPPAIGAKASPYNLVLQPSPDQLLRVSVSVGFHRARLKSVYQLLRGKDLATGAFSETLRTEQFARLREAQATALDLTNWHGFLGVLGLAGFRSSALVASELALIYGYAIYLLGKTMGVEAHPLRQHVARWVFGTSLLSRYTSSSEATMERDLQRLGDVRDPSDFLNVLDGILTTTLTNDFWRTTLPSQLETSSANAPGVLLFYAAQGILNAPALFSQRRVADLIDDAMRPTRKPLERHHLFPRKVLEEQNLDTRAINQAANMALLEWPDNAAIGKQPPSEYAPMLCSRFSEEVWSHMCRLHALPPDWEKLEYAEFLRQRRQLMASVIRLAFDVLSGAHVAADTAMSGDERRAWTMIEDVELTLRRLVRARYQSKWPDRGDAQIRKLLGEDAWSTIVSNREKHAVQYRLHGTGDDNDILDYTYLGQLSQLMLVNEAWEMFKPMFRDRRQLEDLIRGITAVRNDRAHFRQVPETELRRCELACLDLRALLSAG